MSQLGDGRQLCLPQADVSKGKLNLSRGILHQGKGQDGLGLGCLVPAPTTDLHPMLHDGSGKWPWEVAFYSFNIGLGHSLDLGYLRAANCKCCFGLDERPSLPYEVQLVMVQLPELVH